MSSSGLDYIKEKKEDIESLLERYVPRKIDDEYIKWLTGEHRYDYNMEALNDTLSEPIWDYLDRGGKRLRPALFMLFVEAFGGDIEKLKDFAATIELLHNGSIMVDDIEDDSDFRRGKPATHKIFGVDIAINAGNFMYFAGFGPLMKKSNEFSPETMVRAYNAVSKEMIIIHHGQGMDIAWHNGLANADNVTEGEYLQMCANKTGVLLRLAARLAAILTGQDEGTEEALAEFAETIGIAFQIQDDIMNIEPPEKWGKEIGDDINEGKRTLIVIHTLRHATEEDKKRLLEILKMHTKDTDLISEAITIMKKYGSIDYARKFAKELVEKSWKKVSPVIPDTHAKELLRSIATYLVERDI
ncbi:MAG: polyprenyl synthetase family protein [Candidatus Micrarchaeota archaeon]|nr:polyprenyl synthetase family protein [Candidatus Micrarchaeota archaeon]